MRKLLALSLLMIACDQISPSLGGNGQGAAGSAGASGASAAQVPCSGFRDVTGQCLDAACLLASECTPETAEISCGLGSHAQGACFAGRCAYANPAQGCASSSDCRCGLCGVDGRCYEDRQGGCGACYPDGGVSPGQDPKHSTPCKSCLAACAGTGPLCCAGPGCVCEGQCGAYM